MKKRNVVRDLFRTFKYKSSDDIVHSIFGIINKTYKFDIKYLNDVPYPKLLVSLENLILKCADVSCFSYKMDNAYETILCFANSVSNMHYRDLANTPYEDLKYSLKSTYEIIKDKLKRNEKIQQASCFILSTLMVANIYGNYERNKSQTMDLFSDNSVSMLDDVVTHSNADKLEEEKLTYENIEFLEENAVEDLDGLTDKIVTSSKNLQVDSVTDSSIQSEFTLDEKISYILDEYNLTMEEFNVICAVVLKEAKEGSYEDGYAVINTIYNRTYRSARWAYSIPNGTNMYYQVIREGQFTPFGSGSYKEVIGVREGVVFDAIIDFLMTKEIMHDFLSFRGSWVNLSWKTTQYTSNGNKYFNVIKEEDRIVEEIVEEETQENDNVLKLVRTNNDVK